MPIIIITIIIIITVIVIVIIIIIIIIMIYIVLYWNFINFVVVVDWALMSSHGFQRDQNSIRNFWIWLL